MSAPTVRQIDALRFVRSAIDAGKPPTQRELGAHLGCTYKRARELLLALERKGMVERQFHRACSVRLTPAGHQALDASTPFEPAGGGMFRRLGRELPPEAPTTELGDLGPLEDEGSAPKPSAAPAIDPVKVAVGYGQHRWREREHAELSAMLERHAIDGFNGDPADLVRHALEVGSGAAAIGHHGKIGGSR